MKKLQFIFSIILATALLISCQNPKHFSKAEDLGKYTFDFLKKLENVSKEQFLNNLLTLKEFKEFANKKDDSMQDIVKESIERLDKKTYKAGLLRQYTLLKEKGKQYNIVWNDISYVDFTYEQRTDDVMTGIRGNLIFKHKDTEYKVLTSALQDGDIYVPVIINRLSKN